MDYDTDDAEVDARIAKLILSLGSDQYATRRQAQMELELIGVPALDQLQQAILNPDPQIVTAAKYMIRSSYIRWTGRDDPLNVRKLMEQYGSGDFVHRSERIDKLAALPNQQGIPALLRISRYESSVDLSKRAAMAVMSMAGSPPELDSTDRLADDPRLSDELLDAIDDSISNSKGTGSVWLKTYVASARDKTAIDPIWWQSAIDDEFMLLSNKSGDSSREIISELTRWVTEQIAKQGQRDKALEISRNLLRITYSNREKPKVAEDLYTWALSRKMPEIVVDHSTNYLKELEDRIEKLNLNQQGNQPPAQAFGIDRMPFPFATKVRYLRAEAYRQLGDLKTADHESLVAFERVGSMDETGIFERTHYGQFLYERMQYDWAERELQQAWSLGKEQQQLEVYICHKLSMLLADGEDFAGAEKCLRPLIERFETDTDFVRQTDNDLTTESIFLSNDQPIRYTQKLRSLWLFYRAKSKLKTDATDSVWEDLRQSLVCDPENVDIIITMMDVAGAGKEQKSPSSRPKDGEDPRRSEAEKAFASAVVAFRETLPRLESELRASNHGERATYQSRYAMALNTYAWMLASTGHDLEYSLECSELACRLLPNNPAYLDTLARCHFKNNDTAKAIQFQKRAIAAEPAMRELRRNLDVYQSAQK